MKTDVVENLGITAYKAADLAEIAGEMQAIERARLERGGTHSLPLPSRSVMLRMLADLRRELQAVRKARVSLERLARSRDLRHRRSRVPLESGSGPAGRPALFVVRRSR